MMTILFGKMKTPGSCAFQVAKAIDKFEALSNRLPIQWTESAEQVLKVIVPSTWPLDAAPALAANEPEEHAVHA